jgi:hypothetical protein
MAGGMLIHICAHQYFEYLPSLTLARVCFQQFFLGIKMCAMRWLLAGGMPIHMALLHANSQVLSLLALLVQ